MPKVKARKKSGVVRSGQVSRSATVSARNTTITGGTTVETVVRPRQATRAASIQGIIMPGMVALGCWGIAFTFLVFSADPNHLLFGGMAALMAIMWSVSFGVRLRKVLQRK